MALSVPYTFAARTTILSSEANANFQALLSAVDKTGDTLTGNLSCDSGVTVDGVDISAVVGTGGTLLAVNGAAVTNLTAANITAGGTLPALNGSALTSLNATNLASGTVATARLGSGTANSSTYLRGDGSWATPSTGAKTILSKSAGYTCQVTDGVDVVILCNGTFTIDLFGVTGYTGYTVTVKNIGTGTITVDGGGAETIDGDATVAISAQYTSLTLVANGTGWSII